MTHHNHEDSCEESCHNHHHTSCCHPQKEGCHEHLSWSEKLLALADEAWMEVLKEKIKEEIKTHNGAQLDALAKLVSDTNHARWTSKIHGNSIHNNFEEQLKSIFSSGCSDDSCHK